MLAEGSTKGEKNDIYIYFFALFHHSQVVLLLSVVIPFVVQCLFEGIIIHLEGDVVVTTRVAETNGRKIHPHYIFLSFCLNSAEG